MSQLPLSKTRNDFPLLTKRVRGKTIVYLDSAATALKPWPVIERISQFYSYETANVHRGAHYLADQATQGYEHTRSEIAKFIGARHSDEIVFTKGTTESLNLLANTLASTQLLEGDVILLSEVEHHANIVPWQMVAEKVGAQIKVIPVDDIGQLQLEKLDLLLNDKVKIVSVSHCSNTLGTINDVKTIIQKAHAVGAKVVVDGAQMVANQPINVTDLDCDFYVFSAHKMFGPYGVGILYGKKEWLDLLPPYQGGGSMIHQVTFEKTTYNDVPFKFEAGTPNISGVIATAEALKYIQKLGWENIRQHEESLLKLATEKLGEIGGIDFFGSSQNKAPIISFNIRGAHHSDVGQILDQENIAVRAGHHCTQPLMQRYKIPGTVRASFSVFNNEKDIDALVAAIIKAKEFLL